MAQAQSSIGQSAETPPLWLTGAGGLIGSYLLKTAAKHAPAWRVIALTRQSLDLTDTTAVTKTFASQKPLAIIHCAALSKTTDCQANPALARQLNIETTALLAGLAADIPFVFFSSDLVFDGRAGNYDESAQPNPLSIYAETKIAAEQIVLKNPRHTVIRTSLNGGISPTGDRGFNEELRRAWRQGRVLKLFTDEFRSPIPADITARALWQLLSRNQPGLYHLGGSERLSRCAIGQLVATRCAELNPQIEPSSLKDYQGAPRPPDTSLNCAKIQKLLSASVPGLSAWLKSNPHEPF
jgi:dTDP-4-dehydrorhamnose reductase